MTSRLVTAMNKKPVSYLQTDSRWAKKPYRVPGENSTIGSAGCGPSCAAMVISTLTGKTVTPVDTCDWSMKHGYKALNQGTYYSYFGPQLKAYGIQCKQMLGSRILNQPQHPIHEQVKQYLSHGYYVIALMGPGTWTKSGHFVLVWDWDSKVRINDPASTRAERLNGDPEAFRREVRMYWLVDAREFNKEDEAVVTYKYLKDVPEKFRPIINDLMTAGIIQGDGSDPTGNGDVINLTHEQVRTLVFVYRGGGFDRKLAAKGLPTSVN